ncbi:hypothetical protein [Burkholderia savannae]|uniref:hypothetical protein n=1 Tax=Burkholderia savannae TaxID=1637837 RepID=UPI0012E3CE36|nr:hypothetical protein [Burkholderia savannae]
MNMKLPFGGMCFRYEPCVAWSVRENILGKQPWAQLVRSTENAAPNRKNDRNRPDERAARISEFAVSASIYVVERIAACGKSADLRGKFRLDSGGRERAPPAG